MADASATAGASSAADPRPRNPFGQFASGAAVTPKDMNRAYGIRRAAASLRRGSLPPPNMVNAMSAIRRTAVMLEKFDLGEKVPDYACCSPSPAPKRTKWYPTLYVNSDKALGVPRTGKAIIEYQVRSRTAREDEEGKSRYSADIEVHSIEPVKEAKEDDNASEITTKQGVPVKNLAAQVDRVVELAFGDRIMKAAVSPEAGGARLFLRSRLANAIRVQKSMARAIYPKATARAIGWNAKAATQNIEQVLTPKSTLAPAQEARIVAAMRRHSRGDGRIAAGFDTSAKAIELAAGTTFTERGGWYVIQRPDGSTARVPKRGLGNRLQRNTGPIAAGVAGAASVPAAVMIARKLRR